MQALQNILRFLNTQASTPKYLGLFHIFWIILTIAAAVVLCILFKKEIIKNVSRVIIITSVALLVLGLYRQVIFSFTYEPSIKFAYDFNNFPWHFLSVPLIVGLLIGATSGKINKHFSSYLATFGLLAGLWGMFNPNVFVSTIGLNIYSMLCYGSYIVMAVLLLFSKEVKIEMKSFWRALPPFAMFVSIAVTLNEAFHLIASKQCISFFSIGRFCESDAPVYSLLHNAFLNSGDGMTVLEYVVCVLFYFILVSVVAMVPMLIMVGLKKLLTTDFDAEYGKDDNIAVAIRQGEELDVTETTEEIFNFTGKVNTSKNTYVKTYFKNLNTNFGNNNRGSCGYVAASMLLSYYDTALSDKIVPRQFDKTTVSQNEPDFKESPGARFYQPEFNPEEISYKDYVKFINKTKNDYLHERLIKIAIDKKLNTAPEDKESTEFSLGASPNVIKKVLNYYLNDIANVKSSHYNLEFKHVTLTSEDVKAPVTSADIRAYVIEKIKKGYPVWLGISDSKDKDNSHAVVAYEYDEKLDKIYCHFGWEEYKETVIVEEKSIRNITRYTHVTPESQGYDLYDCAIVLDFNEKKLSHTHTNNYEVVVKDAIFYYCPDGRYTTSDDLVVEFGKGKKELSIADVYTKYSKDTLVIPKHIGKVEVASIGKSAFKNQEHLKEVVIEAPLDFISKKAFENCKSIKNVSIPGSVKKIGNDAFKNCRSLTSVVYYGTTEEWYDIKKGNSWDDKTGNYRVYCYDGILFKFSDNEHIQLA